MSEPQNLSYNPADMPPPPEPKTADLPPAPSGTSWATPPQPPQQSAAGVPQSATYIPQGVSDGKAAPYSQYQEYGVPAKKRDNPLKPLFDLKFNKFITLDLLGIVYVIGVVIACLVALLIWGAIFRASLEADSESVSILAFLTIIPILFVLFLHVLLWRVTLEAFAALIRVAINSTKILESTEKIEAAHQRGLNQSY